MLVRRSGEGDARFCTLEADMAGELDDADADFSNRLVRIAIEGQHANPKLLKGIEHADLPTRDESSLKKPYLSCGTATRSRTGFESVGVRMR